jgi:hypothetical protein
MTYRLEVFRASKSIGVCLGPDLSAGFSGFGHDLSAALEDLALDLRSGPNSIETRERAELRQELALHLQGGAPGKV